MPGACGARVDPPCGKPSGDDVCLRAAGQRTGTSGDMCTVSPGPRLEAWRVGGWGRLGLRRGGGTTGAAGFAPSKRGLLDAAAARKRHPK